MTLAGGLVDRRVRPPEIVMIRKTDRFFKRKAKVYERGYFHSESANDTVTEIVRRETWWAFWIIPVFSMDTIIYKPR